MPNWKKVIVSGSDATFNHITASGNIRAASMTIGTGTVYDTNLNLANDGKIRIGNAEYIDKDGNDLNLFQGKLKIHHVGGGATFSGAVTASGNISASGNITANSIIADNTDDDAIIKLLDADGNGIASLARIGSSANAHIGRMVLRDNANIKVDIRATGNSYINGTSAKLGIGTDSPGEALTVNGNISASGAQTQVEAISGSFSVLTGDTSVGTSLEVGGPITGSAFQGTKHILRSMAFYVNANPMVQNSVYLGNSLGNSPNNWNDPQAVGGAITSNNLTIAEDDMNWGYILPFDISKIEVQCSLRPALGAGDDFTVVIYTGTRSNNSNTNLTLTKVANSSGVVFGTSQRYVTNDITYTADLDKGTLIYVGVGSEDATDAKNARGLMNITITAK